MALTLVVTAAGRAALVNAAHDGTAPVRIAAVGVSAQALVASAATAALPGEIKRITTLSGDVVAADTIHLIVRDESDASYTVRSLALYLADGTLFGAYGQAGVIVEKSVQALLLLAIDVRFADIAAAELSFGNANFLNPPATADRMGVVELATEDEAKAGDDPARAITPRTAKAAVRQWIGYTPANKAGETFTGPIARDSQFYLDYIQNNPLINFGFDRYFSFNRTTGAGAFVIDGQVALSFTSNGPSTRNNVIWHAGNDGSGSGLDADLLDGLDSSHFANIPARLGFTPVRQGTGAGQTASTVAIGWDGSGLRVQVDATDLGRLAFQSSLGDVWRTSNDGSGSGLDADLLDGQQGSWYADVKTRLGYEPANKAGDTFAGTVATGGDFYLNRMSDAWGYIVRPNVAGYRNLAFAAASGATLDQVDANTHLLTRRGSKVWDAGNDGAGSGLDADLLDGQDSGFYRDIPARLGYVPLDVNSYTPNDIIARTMQVDGSGSGLDADILDGQQGSWYADVPARLGFVPANKAGQIFDGPIGPEAGFQMVFSDGNPGIVFTKDNRSSVFYSRNTGYYTFYNNGRAVFDVDGNGNARFRGTVTQNVNF